MNAMGRKVLIIDHQPNLILCLQYLLERSGLTVETARTGAEALDRAAAVRPDVVLLETHLPDMDGYAVYQQLRDRLGSETAVLIVTARSREVDRDKALALGADGYFTKPFDASAVVRRIQSLTRTAA